MTVSRSVDVSRLINVCGRKDSNIDPAGARQDLAEIVAVGVCRYRGKLNGLASPLFGSACGLRASRASGVTFTDRLPDLIWRYVLVHELGHYFGLCHVDGLERIMFATGEGPLSWSTLPRYIYLSGEPTFTFDEAKAAWDFIIEHFPPSALMTRAS